MYTVSPRRIPCRICGNYTAEQMVYGTYLTGPRPGFSLDPQDLSTMYQDAAGTLPVYRPGTGLVDPPMGLMLDKSQGLVLGPELVTNGDFSDGATGWNLGTGWSVASGVATGVTGAASAVHQVISLKVGAFYKITVNSTLTTGVDLRIVLGDLTNIVPGPGVFAIISTGSYEFFLTPSAPATHIAIRKSTSTGAVVDNISCHEIKGYHAYQSDTMSRPTLSGRYNLLLATDTLATQSVTTEATDYTLRLEGTGTITLSGTATGPYSAGTHTITCTAGTLTCTVSGAVTNADLRKTTAQTLPEYQSVTDANNYDTAGFPLYLRRDLIDDELIVQSPGFSGQRIAADFDAVTSDAVTIAAGEYKPFGAVDAGPAECTQLLVVAAPSADEVTVFERYAAEKGLLHGGV